MFENTSTADLESEMVGLAGHLAAGQCRFLQLMAEFDSRESWVGPGLRSCAHWLNWRVGLSLRTAREQLRVAHALRRLPAITAAFSAGRISYAKVRAITRIATPETEQELLDLALVSIASQVERVVRETRRAGLASIDACMRRHLTWRWDDDGSLVLRARLPADEGAVLVAAIEAGLKSAESLADAASEPAVPDVRGSAEPVVPDVRGSAEPVVPDVRGSAEPVVPTARGSVGPAVPAARGSAEHTEPTASGSPELVEPQPGCSAEPCEPRLNWAAWQAERVARAAEHTPGAAIDRLGARRADALVALAKNGCAEPYQVVVQLDAASLDAHIANGPAVPQQIAEQLACDAPIRALVQDGSGQPLHLGRTQRLATGLLRRAVDLRDQGRCRFPGCDASRFLHSHHLRSWLRGGPTNITNIALLCSFHHRLVHQRRYRAAWRGDVLEFRRPDGTAVPATGPPTSGQVDYLVERHTERGLQIDDWTITPDWHGERLDLNAILDRLLLAEPAA